VNEPAGKHFVQFITLKPDQVPGVGQVRAHHGVAAVAAVDRAADWGTAPWWPRKSQGIPFSNMSNLVSGTVADTFSFAPAAIGHKATQLLKNGQRLPSRRPVM
jgi:hypothetical protein